MNSFNRNICRAVLLAVGALGGCQITPSDKLVSAASNGDVATVKSELARGVNVNGRNFAGATALNGAANMCEVEVVKLLLAAHADPNEEDADPRSSGAPIIVAAGASDQGCPQVVSALVAAGANVNARNNHGVTALDTAANEGEVEVANVLIAAGANVNGRHDGITPLFYTQGDPPGRATRQGRAAVALMLRQHGGHL